MHAVESSSALYRAEDCSRDCQDDLLQGLPQLSCRDLTALDADISLEELTAAEGRWLLVELQDWTDCLQTSTNASGGVWVPTCRSAPRRSATNILLECSALLDPEERRTGST